MNCALCKNGETVPGFATIPLQRGETTVIFKGVPAFICKNCGEHTLSEDVAAQVYALAERAAQSGAEVEILRYAA